MKKIIPAVLVLVSISVLFFVYQFVTKTKLVSPLAKHEKKEKPLDKYTFQRLGKQTFLSNEIILGSKIDEDAFRTSYLFYFKDGDKKVSGLMNIPKSSGTYPIVVQFRGFIPKEQYESGIGTKHSGEVFAKNGFITLAPDFLGYGESASPSASSIEERFQTYTTGLSLLASLPNLNTALRSTSVSADISKIGIWGHSNGGHIALSILAITGKPYPTVLWNPVTKPFPYSILYFTDEFEDNGKALRKVVANFEKDYDAEIYSPTNYYKWITAPIQLHQSIDDEAVPIRWSNQFVQNLESLKKNITYFIYPGEDHDFSKGSWSSVVERNIEFFKQQFSK